MLPFNSFENLWYPELNDNIGVNLLKEKQTSRRFWAVLMCFCIDLKFDFRYNF